jgi:hypothetical protein
VPTLWIVALVCVFAVAQTTQEWKPDEGFTSLYNGKDLTGWCYRVDGKEEVFDGKTEASDGRYSAKGDSIVVNPLDPAKGPRLRQLATVRTLPKNFTLKIEFRAAPNADSGIFILGTQLQCRDYLVAGPDKYKALKKYKPQDWNEIVVTVKDGVAHCECNGEVLEDALKLAGTGGLGLEADRGQMEYRRIQVKEAT